MIIDEFWSQITPPPALPAEFPLMMQSVIVMDEFIPQYTPPPSLVEFSAIVQLVRVTDEL
jgi:hypothetical protein